MDCKVEARDHGRVRGNGGRITNVVFESLSVAGDGVQVVHGGQWEV